MIQFNLLPDVKLEYIKAKRTKRLVVLLSVIIAGVSVSLAVLVFAATLFQKQHLKDLDRDIARDSQKLQQTNDINKILTIQNQLNELPALHEQKAATSRFKDYLTQITPTNISYARIELSIAESTMHFTGSADSLRTINQFVDTLKFTNYKVQGSDEEKRAFSEVVLVEFGRDDKGASYDIMLNFSPDIFNNKQVATLAVPQTITTRSVTEKPNENLFQKLSDPKPTEASQ